MRICIIACAIFTLFQFSEAFKNKCVTECIIPPTLCDCPGNFKSSLLGAKLGFPSAFGSPFPPQFGGYGGFGCDKCVKSIMLPKIKNIVCKKLIKVPVLKTIYKKPKCKKLIIPKLNNFCQLPLPQPPCFPPPLPPCFSFQPPAPVLPTFSLPFQQCALPRQPCCSAVSPFLSARGYGF